jgi:hypothetical protein
MADLGFAEAFAQYCAKLRNVQWSVCADAPDGSLVVSLWQHHFDPPKDGAIVCRDSFDRWSGPGNSEFREKVTRAFESHQRVRVVIAHTKKTAEVQAGADASTLPKTFSVREDWLGEVASIVGSEYVFRFTRVNDAV